MDKRRFLRCVPSQNAGALNPASIVGRVPYRFHGGIDCQVRNTLARVSPEVGGFLAQSLAGGTDQTFFSRRTRQHEGDGRPRQEPEHSERKRTRVHNATAWPIWLAVKGYPSPFHHRTCLLPSIGIVGLICVVR